MICNRPVPQSPRHARCDDAGIGAVSADRLGPPLIEPE